MDNNLDLLSDNTPIKPIFSLYQNTMNEEEDSEVTISECDEDIDHENKNKRKRNYSPKSSDDTSTRTHSIFYQNKFLQILN